ncbi:sel1 repeat family protein (plasmid) [Gordonia amicalis]|nr:tetratricopeptide repeat protein [Gordonia amicalis]UOG23824.1 sel1 repeat family protein [Gordonia amicalis]
MREYLLKHQHLWQQFDTDETCTKWIERRDAGGNYLGPEAFAKNVREWKRRSKVPRSEALRSALVEVVGGLVSEPPPTAAELGEWRSFREVLLLLAGDRDKARDRGGSSAKQAGERKRLADAENSLAAAGPIREIDPRLLNLGSWAFNSEAPPYIARTADYQLVEHIRAASGTTSVVTVVGAPKAGKSRSVYEVLLKEMPSAVCWWHNPSPFRAIPDLVHHLQKVKTTDTHKPNVIVLDDVALNGLNASDGLTHRRLTQIVQTPSVDLVVVIIHAEDLAAWRNHTAGARTPGSGVLAELAGIGASRALVSALDEYQVFYPSVLDPAEKDASSTVIAQLHDSNRGLDLSRLGEALASIDKLTKSAEFERSKGSVRGAIVEAAIDASVLQPGGVDLDLLESLAKHHRQTSLAPNARWRTDEFDEAIDSWATRGLAPGSPHAILVRVANPAGREHYRLLDALIPEMRATNRDFDHLVSEDSLLQAAHYNNIARYLAMRNAGGAIEWWVRGAHAGDAESMFFLGVLAAKAGDSKLAIEWWTCAADRGDEGARLNLGVTAYEAGDLNSAIEWWTPLADTGNLKALFNLGVVSRRNGDVETAKRLLTRAAEAGFSDALMELAAQADDEGESETAIVWWTRAAEASNAKAMYNLGVKATIAGNSKTAMTWWTRAASAGSTEAMRLLGDQAAKSGDLKTATTWWTRAVEAGDTEEMYNFGCRAEQAGDLQTAINWWTQAAQAGHTGSMYNIGCQAEQAGDLQTAINWWTQAAQAGHTDSMYNIGCQADHAGDIQTATNWWTQAAQAGHTSAMFNLGTRAWQAGESDTASAWWTQAASAGHVDSIYSLGGVAHANGDIRAAVKWWTQAAEAGHASAMFNLGQAAEQRRDNTAATYWWTKAADAGHANAMYTLGAKAAVSGDLDSALELWTRAAAAGSQLAADALRRLGYDW